MWTLRSSPPNGTTDTGSCTFEWNIHNLLSNYCQYSTDHDLKDAGTSDITDEEVESGWKMETYDVDGEFIKS
jgi:hypothetical protein